MKMTKAKAKRIIKEKFGKTIKGRTQLNAHGCGEYSLSYCPKNGWFEGSVSFTI